MANIVEQSITVKEIDPGILEVANHQIYDNGINMSTTLMFDRSAAGWLAKQVNATISSEFRDVDTTIGLDHFILFIGGSDMQPFIHIHNTRDLSSPHGGKTYTISFTEAIALSLVDQLQTYVVA
jgi:hypothetical protein